MWFCSARGGREKPVRLYTFATARPRVSTFPIGGGSKSVFFYKLGSFRWSVFVKNAYFWHRGRIAKLEVDEKTLERPYTLAPEFPPSL